MTLADSAILGVVEGLTEFLPISSTGHMIVVSSWLGLEQNSNTKAFEVIIQLAAIAALFGNYKERFTLQEIRLWMKIFVAFLPLAIVGFIFRHEIKELFSVEIVAVMFIVGGLIFLLVEKFYDDKSHYKRRLEDVGWREAVVIGLFQVFALIPGTSRAGSTIIGAMLSGLDRKTSAEFSFLLALPVMLAASAYDILSHWEEFGNQDIATLGAGFLTAFVTALLAMRLFIGFLERFTFVSFGIYRILFGLLLLTLY